MRAKEIRSGQAFEYSLALSLQRLVGGSIDQNRLNLLKPAYDVQASSERERVKKATGKVAQFIVDSDENVRNSDRIVLPKVSVGQGGDVRDIIMCAPGGVEVGISAKHRHRAVKHSRLSDKIDFGTTWTGHHVSALYWEAVKPVFGALREKRSASAGKALFRELPDKQADIYLPILKAFENELSRLCEAHGKFFVSRLFNYLLGLHDYYKVIKENGKVTVQSMNMNGTLKWGKKWCIPERVDSIKRKNHSSNTLFVSFAGGWQLSFRLHNATSRIEPSLKFDIQFANLLPQNVTRHEISF